jgi:DNA cross-link repair 1A protein
MHLYFKQYTFPPQPLVISACAELARRINSEDCLAVDSRIQTLDALLNATPNKKQDENERGDQKVLFVIGYGLGCTSRTANMAHLVNRTYSIGKERIVKGKGVCLPQ